MPRTSRVLAVSVPPEVARELFREMLRVYRVYLETRTFESLQRYGAARAAGAGIRTEADVRRVIRNARR